MRYRIFFSIVIVLGLSSMSFSEDIDRTQAEEIALAFAKELNQEASLWHTVPYYSTDLETVVYEVTLSKNTSAKGYRSELKRLLKTGKIDYREDVYLTVLIGCVKDLPPVVAYYDGLPAHLVAYSKILVAEGVRRPFSGDFVDRVTYVSPFKIFISLCVEGRQKTYNMLDLTDQQGREIPATIELPAEQAAANREEWQAREGRDKVSAPKRRIKTDERIISGVADWNQPNDYPGSCGPTSAACLLDYWDRNGCPKLRTGTSRDLIIELAQAMGWVANEGVTPLGMEQGLKKVCTNPSYGRGYSFSIGRMMGISLSEFRNEIDGGYPFCYGSYSNPWGGGHAVCGVGYSGNYIIVHDNWPSTPADYYVNWNSIGHYDDLIVYVHPNGAPNNSRSVISPGGGATWTAGNRYEIQWSGFSGSKVRIELHRNSGYVRTISSSTSNDGSQNWAVPTNQQTASDYRVKVISTSNSGQTAFSGSFTITNGSDGGGGGGGGGRGGSPAVSKPGAWDWWWAGDSYDIKWSGFSGSTVRIDLCFGWYWVGTISASTSNDGVFSWRVPGNTGSGIFYYIMVSSSGGDAAYSNYFTIF
jgi:hypothetical protein